VRKICRSRIGSLDLFLKQLKWLAAYADLRSDRHSEILAQTGDIVSFFASIGFLHPERTRWTFELLGAVLRATIAIEMRFKHALACRRPIEYGGQVQPMIQTPGHGALPSGHATECFAIATVLAELASGANGEVYGDAAVWREQYMRQASRIAVNRTVAGVHFPVDTAAGAFLGICLGQYFLARLRPGRVELPARVFDGEQFAERDFLLRHVLDFFDNGTDSTGTYSQAGRQPCMIATESGPITWLWSKASAEWN
jgi:membrane-associated phospholipid phosphatase